MPRAVDGTRRKDRREKILKQTKGHMGKRSKLHRVAKDSLAKALTYAYRDRRGRRREFRQLWIARISAACRSEGMTYSRFISGLSKANVQMDRKALSNLAIEDAQAFKALVEKAKEAVGV
ncbi:MAG TPA: 50S ribosomal protein L20 [Spirochaetia bacterium]|nr:50S ribosomal protein L20 [Spirochaetia bacterium]